MKLLWFVIWVISRMPYFKCIYILYATCNFSYHRMSYSHIQSTSYTLLSTKGFSPPWNKFKYWNKDLANWEPQKCRCSPVLCCRCIHILSLSWEMVCYFLVELCQGTYLKDVNRHQKTLHCKHLIIDLNTANIYRLASDSAVQVHRDCPSLSPTLWRWLMPIHSAGA